LGLFAEHHHERNMVRVNSNAGPNQPGVKLCPESPQDAMRIYDSLPPEIRRELAQASVVVAMTPIRDDVRISFVEWFRKELTTFARRDYLTSYPGIAECNPPGKVRY
jgi:hypothetical protein